MTKMQHHSQSNDTEESKLHDDLHVSLSPAAPEGTLISALIVLAEVNSVPQIYSSKWLSKRDYSTPHQTSPWLPWLGERISYQTAAILLNKSMTRKKKVARFIK